MPKPDYSGAARIEGAVDLKVVVNERPQPAIMKILRGQGYGFEAKAISAVSRGKSEPAKMEGRPVAIAIAAVFNSSRGTTPSLSLTPAGPPH